MLMILVAYAASRFNTSGQASKAWALISCAIAAVRSSVVALHTVLEPVRARHTIATIAVEAQVTRAIQIYRNRSIFTKHNIFSFFLDDRTWRSSVLLGGAGAWTSLLALCVWLPSCSSPPWRANRVPASAVASIKGWVSDPSSGSGRSLCPIITDTSQVKGGRTFWHKWAQSLDRWTSYVRITNIAV